MFSRYLLIGALAATQAFAATDGLLCVDQVVIDLFDAINSIRVDTTSSTAYIALAAN